MADTIEIDVDVLRELDLKVDQLSAEVKQLEADRDYNAQLVREAQAERDAALAELDALRRHYDASGPEHNLLDLLDLYDDRRVAAESERDAALAREAKAIQECENARELMERALARETEQQRQINMFMESNFNAVAREAVMREALESVRQCVGPRLNGTVALREQCLPALEAALAQPDDAVKAFLERVRHEGRREAERDVVDSLENGEAMPIAIFPALLRHDERVREEKRVDCVAGFVRLLAGGDQPAPDEVTKALIERDARVAAEARAEDAKSYLCVLNGTSTTPKWLHSRLTARDRHVAAEAKADQQKSFDLVYARLVAEARRAALEPLEALAVNIAAENDEDTTGNGHLDALLSAVFEAAEAAGLNTPIERAAPAKGGVP